MPTPQRIPTTPALFDRPGTLNIEWIKFFSVLLRGVGGGTGVLATTPLVYASLPAPAKGMIATVTDSTVTAWGATVAGGGANTVLAWFDGTDWVVVGA